MTEEINTSIVRHESFVERHPRYEFIPLTREDFEVTDWKESFPEYDGKNYNNMFNDPRMMKTFTLKVPFSKEEANENFLSFNVFYLNSSKTRSWKGVQKLQAKRQKIKDEMFEELREDIKENGEKYIDEKIAEVNASIQKLIDRLNKDYVEKNSEMILNAFERMNTDWIKEVVYS